MKIFKYSEFITEKKTEKDTSYGKNILFDQIHPSVPLKIINIIVDEWPFIYYKSPYGQSYYSEKVGWDFKPHNSYRMSDHWNFYANRRRHCETSNSVENDTHWSIGIFDQKTKKYKIILSLPKVDPVINKEEIVKLKEKYYKEHGEEIAEYYKSVNLREKELTDKKSRKVDKLKEINRYIANFFHTNLNELEIYVDGIRVNNVIQFTLSKLRYIDNGEIIAYRNRNYDATDIRIVYKGVEILHKESKSNIDKEELFNTLKMLIK